MIVFPNCKINLGLHVLNKRTDGFHNLETIFLPLPLSDALEIISVDPETEQTNPVRLSTSGQIMDGDPADNLCVGAYHILKKDFPRLPPVVVHLHKAIPVGAGLGGGSADGAFTLKLLNKKYKLGLEKDQLIQYAAELGSDCPFFILNTPGFASGRGEIVEPVRSDLQDFKIVIVFPYIHISTAWAFSVVTPHAHGENLKEAIAMPVARWKDKLKNDFEDPVFEAYPEIKKIKDHLVEKGALYASMSGSGSAVYGIFDRKTVPAFEFPEQYFVKELAGQL